MAVDFTTTRLLARVRKRAGLPPFDEGLDAELLERVNDEQRLYLTALLESAKEQYKQTTLDLTVGASLRVPVPTRAIAAGIKMLEGVDSSGKRWFLTELKDENFGRIRTGDYYVEGNELVFFRAPLQSTVRVTYSRRLSELVQTSAARAISAINFNTKTVTIIAGPASFATLTAFDLVQGKPHFDLLAMEAACSAPGAGTSVVFTSALPASLAVGDWVCVPGESPVVQAPLELHPLLAQQTALQYLSDKGDNVAIAEATKRRDREERDVKMLIQPRVEQGQKIVNPNAPGWGGWPRRLF